MERKTIEPDFSFLATSLFGGGALTPPATADVSMGWVVVGNPCQAALLWLGCGRRMWSR